VESCEKEIVARYRFDKVKRVVPGGKRRQDSVRLGLEATGGDYELVLIHDGVRPIIETELIERVIESTRSHRAVITGLPSKETVKEISDVGRVIKTYDRQSVWLIQTPQAFYYDDISAVHQKAFAEGWEEATDDCALIEKAGIPVKVIEGSEKNIKITTPHDLELARFFLSGVRPGISDSQDSRG
jgi:2-C-methyl-D-erythritol 4-phosphate cytidylyltransferase